MNHRNVGIYLQDNAVLERRRPMTTSAFHVILHLPDEEPSFRSFVEFLFDLQFASRPSAVDRLPTNVKPDISCWTSRYQHLLNPLNCFVDGINGQTDRQA
jgi:hypothetical protein